MHPVGSFSHSYLNRHALSQKPGVGPLGMGQKHPLGQGFKAVIAPRFAGQVTELQDLGIKFYNSPKTLVENQAYIERKGALQSKTLAKRLQAEKLLVLTGPPDAGLDILMEATMASYKTSAREKTPTVRHNGPLGRSDWNQLVFLTNGNQNAEAQILAINNAQEAFQQDGHGLIQKLKTLLEKNPNLKIIMTMTQPAGEGTSLKEPLVQAGLPTRQLIEVPSLSTSQKYQWLNVILNNADFTLQPKGTLIERLGQKLKGLFQSILKLFGRKPAQNQTPTIDWHGKIMNYLDTSKEKSTNPDQSHATDNQGLDHHVRSLLLAFAAYFKTVPNRLDEQKKDTKEFITPDVLSKLPWNPLLDGSVL